MNFNQEKLERYSRNILLPEIGGIGQEKLLNSKVLIIGAGGLGSSLIMYLAAAGVGHISIIDHDRVEISNLQRQVIHDTNKINMYKVNSAKNYINDLNPDIKVNAINQKLTLANATSIIKNHDVIADGCDNFDTRYIVADTCFKEKKILVSAAITKYEGQISTWKNISNTSPCFRCLFPNKPNNASAYTCSTNGVLGSLAGFMGSIQATEVIKEILGIGKSLSGYINIYDLLNNQSRKIEVGVDPNCNFCKKLR